MDEFDFGRENNMFDSEDEFDLNIEDVYEVPVDIILHMQNKSEPIFAQHVFFFEKINPISSIEELMNFTSTWWSAISEDKNINFVYLSDTNHNKKAILMKNVVAVSFVAPEKPEWMEDGQNITDPD